MKRALGIVLFVLVAVSCGQQAPPLTSGIDMANMDTSVRPQDDFFRYVNGTWLDTTEIPADQTISSQARTNRRSPISTTHS